MRRATALLPILLIMAACVHAQSGVGGTGGIGGVSGWQDNGHPKLQITTNKLPDGTIGVAYTATIATKFGTLPLTFSVASGSLPNGLTLNATTGVISGTPGNNAGTFSFVIQVTDSSSPTPQFALQSYSISILCTHLSILTQSALPTADQGVAYSFLMTAQGGIVPLSWSATGLPTGEGIVSGTGQIAGTPTVTGAFSPQITVSDSCPVPQSVKGNFTQLVNSALAITSSTPLPDATVGTSYTTQLAAAGGTPAYSWSILSGALPAGLALNASTGVITGTPTNPQTTTPRIQVSDTLAATAAKNFTITAACQVLTITSASLPNGTQNQLYSFQMQSSGGFGTQTWTASGLPSGITISNSGLISGTPTAQGSFAVSVTTTDSCPTAQAITQNYTLSISASVGPLAITSATTLPPVKVGANYTQQLQATGGVTPYAWSILNNTFPPGIVLNATGVVSGIATTAGTYTPTVQVADNVSTTTSAVFTLVTSCPAAPVIVSTSPIPQGTQGQPYNFQFAASGGVLPYAWTLAGGTLPTGITLASNGTLSGTPTNTGTFSPQIKVTDACRPTGSTATTTFTFVIAANSGALTISSTSPLQVGVQGQAFTTNILVTGGTPPYTFSTPSATVPGGAIDILDYAMMPLPDRNNFHLAGTALKYFHLDAGLMWWMKGANGNPWDGEMYDGSFIYQWFTEGDSSNNAVCQAAGFSSCFTDPFANKMYVNPVPLWPRYFVPGTDIVTTTPGPNLYVQTANCGADAQAPINNLDIKGELQGPFTDVNFGGSIPNAQPYLLATKYIKGTAGTYLNREQYWLVLGYGQAKWCPATWNGSSYTVGTCSTDNNKVAGGAPTPNFACKVPNIPASSNPPAPGLTTISAPQMNLQDTTGKLSGTPIKSGSYTFKVQVEDSIGTIVQKNFTHVISCLAFSTTSTSPVPGGVVGQPYNFQFTTSGGAQPVTWGGTSIPAGLSLSVSGLLSGTPTAAATTSMSITATDGCLPTPQTSTTSFSITIAAATPALQIVTTSPLPAATEGQPYNVQMAAQGGVSPYTWSKTAGSLATGLTINASGLISGTPTATGTATSTLQVADSAAHTASGSFVIVTSCPTLTITSPLTLPPATQGAAYSFQLTSSGGIVPITWGASGLPTGLSLATTGALTGTPSVSGTFTPTITATDSCAPTPQAPSSIFTIQVNNGLAITTNTPLASGTVNSAYASTMSAAGGTPPYTWSITSGALPTGLSLAGSTGIISGTPTVAQTTTPTIKVTDSLTANVSKVFSITINAVSGADNRYCTPAGTWLGPTTDAGSALPKVCMNTALANTPSPGTVHGPYTTLSTLQAAINAGACGDVYTITAGTDLGTGTLSLPAKGCDNAHWNTIETTGISNGSFPAEGTRLTPCSAGKTSMPGRPAYSCATPTNLMFKISAPLAGNAIVMNGDHYRIIGAYITRVQTHGLVFFLIDLPNTSPFSNNLILDRVWMDGVEGTFPQTAANSTETQRAISLRQANHIALIDSYVSNIYCDSGITPCDSQVMGGGTGSKALSGWGVYKMVNTHAEAAAEGMLLGGGGGPALTPTGCTILVNCNLDTPADLEIRRNYFFKPQQWNGNTTTPGGFGWPIVKNGFEMKTGARALFEGNVIENIWYGAQVGYTFSIAPVNQQNGGTPGLPTCPTCTVRDFTYRYNYSYNVAYGIAVYAFLPGGCPTCQNQGAWNVSIHDNLIGDNLNLGNLTSQSAGDAMEILSANDSTNQGLNQIKNLNISHNTFVKAIRGLTIFGGPAAGKPQIAIIAQNNIWPYANFGFMPVNNSGTTCEGPNVVDNAYVILNGCTTSYTWDHNAVFNWLTSNGGTLGSKWPTNGSGAGNFFYTGFAPVGFTSYGTGNSNFNPSNYQLLNTSPLHNMATDGTDIGANIPLVQSNIAGVRQ